MFLFSVVVEQPDYSGFFLTGNEDACGYCATKSVGVWIHGNVDVSRLKGVFEGKTNFRS